MVSATSEGAGGEGTTGLLKSANDAVTPCSYRLDSVDVVSLSDVVDSATIRISSG